MRRIAWCAGFLLGFAVPGNHASDRDVLIVYTSGIPSKTISEIPVGEADAASGATPKAWNCRLAAETIGFAFHAKGYSVHVAHADSVRSADELLDRGIVVFGMPARFWNVPWDMKRFIDVFLGRVYVSSKTEIQKIVFGGFAMAELAASGERALEAFGWALGDCGTKFSVTEVFLANEPPSSGTVRDRINRLVDGLIEASGQAPGP
jgi:hypothetical protein